MTADAAAAAVVRAAPAKLNLYLHVTGKRADGYHLLDSLIAFADVHDTIAVTEAESITLNYAGPFAANLPLSVENIVTKAAQLLRESASVAAGADIVLAKRLPVASGIGGGSADAAAALRALDRLWGCRAGEEDLAALALALGADVPVCLYGRAAFVSGIGENIAAAPELPVCHLVLANPGVAVSTAEVFRSRPRQYGEAGRFDRAPKTFAAFAELLSGRRNDLAETAIKLQPPISDCLEALNASPGCALARMSGSGATCFGLFADVAAAERAAAAIGKANPGWWVVPARLVTDTSELERAG